jgi:hypothetical protein
MDRIRSIRSRAWTGGREIISGLSGPKTFFFQNPLEGGILFYDTHLQVKFNEMCTRIDRLE